MLLTHTQTLDLAQRYDVLLLLQLSIEHSILEPQMAVLSSTVVQMVVLSTLMRVTQTTGFHHHRHTRRKIQEICRRFFVVLLLLRLYPLYLPYHRYPILPLSGIIDGQMTK